MRPTLKCNILLSTEEYNFHLGNVSLGEPDISMFLPVTDAFQLKTQFLLVVAS